MIKYNPQDPKEIRITIAVWAAAILILLYAKYG